MRTIVTFRHIEASDPLKLYAEEKLSRVKRYIE
ncbi:MAG: HPF/RaiA family ribosome-associated protein, partial [Desulfobacteraceae bacterium]|nr:HPF/RaiA family ribosome-associated protein [Desulfobacteraceae bacterium]